MELSTSPDVIKDLEELIAILQSTPDPLRYANR